MNARTTRLPEAEWWGRTFAALLVLTACASDRAANPGEPPHAGPGAPAEDATTPIDLDTISERSLDTLSGGEAQAVCEEDARRSDRCLELGLIATETPAECEQYVATCRAGNRIQDTAALCRDMTFGPPGSCSVSVGAFLRCVDARKATLQCSEAGYVMNVPEACVGVVADCPRLSLLFPGVGRTYPCDPDAGSDRPPDTNDDIFGADGCRPTPTRLVILGDSVANTFKLQEFLEDRLRSIAGPNLVVERFSVDGTRVAALPGQARRAAPGPGHVFVFIWSIANDMTGGDVVRNLNADLAPYRAPFDEVFGYFGDPGLFPDGATFLLNTQYWPFDLCDVPGSRRDPGPVLRERFLQINQVLFLDVAQARFDTIAIDHYPDFLGHGDNANVRGCPYCGRDNTPWTMASHPNEVGSAHIADKWAVAFDRMLGPSCRP
jgi:hypothetical protein